MVSKSGGILQTLFYILYHSISLINDKDKYVSFQQHVPVKANKLLNFQYQRQLKNMHILKCKSHIEVQEQKSLFLFACFIKHKKTVEVVTLPTAYS